MNFDDNLNLLKAAFAALFIILSGFLCYTLIEEATGPKPKVEDPIPVSVDTLIMDTTAVDSTDVNTLSTFKPITEGI